MFIVMFAAVNERPTLISRLHIHPRRFQHFETISKIRFPFIHFEISRVLLDLSRHAHDPTASLLLLLLFVFPTNNKQDSRQQFVLRSHHILIVAAF
jgi:hypothetical protein